jgi:luciferase family oxidoreductase group 1
MSPKAEFTILDYVCVGGPDMRLSTRAANSVKLAQIAEAAGFERYWIAEHHGENLEGPSPEVVMAAIAANTRRIRVGSASILMTYYSPLKIAETFHTLAALFPGRIDLGFGRGGAGDKALTASLMDGRPEPADGAERTAIYKRKVVETIEHLIRARGAPAETPAAGSAPSEPAQHWIMGSQTDGAELAARIGAHLAFALFFGTSAEIDPAAILKRYTENFVPGIGGAERASFSITLAGVCADTDAEADLIRAQLENRFLAERLNFCGSPEHCRKVIAEAMARYGTNRVVLLPLSDTFAQQAHMIRQLGGIVMSDKAPVVHSQAQFSDKSIPRKALKKVRERQAVKAAPLVA